jgi:hypothetical protein
MDYFVFVCFFFFVQKVGANEDSEAANTQSKGACGQAGSGQGHQ